MLQTIVATLPDQRTAIRRAAVLVALALSLIAPAGVAQADAPHYKDASYEIERQTVTLSNGVSEVAAAPGSASKVTVRYFGNEATGDLNGDGTSDVGFLLTRTTGGSGTFYYVVAALKTADGYAGTNAILLGDRIAPQTTEMRPDGTLVVNFAERKPGEPMTTAPSVGVSKYLRVVSGRLVEVVPTPAAAAPAPAKTGNAGPSSVDDATPMLAFAALVLISGVAAVRFRTAR